MCLSRVVANKYLLSIGMVSCVESGGLDMGGSGIRSTVRREETVRRRGRGRVEALLVAIAWPRGD